MDDEEVIRRRMEQTRESLAEKLETLEQRVVGSVSAVADTVANVKAKVDEGVESVKEAVDIQAHVDRHPWLMLGGSVVCGYVLGNVLGGNKDKVPEARPASRPTARMQTNGHRTEQGSASPSWLGAFEPELKKLKGLALGVTLGTVRELLTAEVPPHVAEQLRDIIDAVTAKAGGETIPSSDWTATQSASPSQAAPERSETAQNPRW
jgi:ElaB/YqjD/DUF883 family membrane-anchored ribosome-binding protein